VQTACERDILEEIRHAYLGKATIAILGIDRYPGTSRHRQSRNTAISTPRWTKTYLFNVPMPVLVDWTGLYDILPVREEPHGRACAYLLYVVAIIDDLGGADCQVWTQYHWFVLTS
jgi:hypothetical protein